MCLCMYIYTIKKKVVFQCGPEWLSNTDLWNYDFCLKYKPMAVV